LNIIILLYHHLTRFDSFLCLQQKCFVWNYPDERLCSRCGHKKQPPRSNDNTKGNKDGSLSEEDEFGRKLKKKKKITAEQEWPPCFQDHSEGFVLDSRSGKPIYIATCLDGWFNFLKTTTDRRSPCHTYCTWLLIITGMFYEEKSDFFYDPTSKLYYGNKKGAYFSYNADKDTFVPIDSSAEDGETKKLPPAGSKGATTTEDQDHLMLVPHGANHKTETTEPSKHKMIAIKIKTKIATPIKKKKKRSDSTTTDHPVIVKDKDKDKPPMSGDNEPANVIQKQHEASLMRWSERQDELAKSREGETGTGTNAGGLSRPRFTKHGKPICWVCKRKFDSLEKLQRHEEMSTMHKENLAKQKDHSNENVAKLPGEESGKYYVDRAQQRRDLYGPELTLPDPVFHGVNVSGTTSALPSNGDEQLSIDPNSTNNVGQQMLEKLGWKEGTMLGRGNDQQKEQQAALAQDWNRIESLAAKNKQSGGRSYRS
jgi:OCRE domain/G-patch domain